MISKDAIELKSYAKINLSLEVTGRRADGYHDIRSFMQGISLFDVIKITKCPRKGTKYNLPHCTIGSIVVYLCTDAKTIPTDMSNLAFKGLKAVLDEFIRTNDVQGDFVTLTDLVVTLDKRLPVAAGIAGGSGNAAVCMLGLNALLGNPFSLRELMAVGAKVGADVPFSLMMNARMNYEVLKGHESCEGLRGLDEASESAWIRGIGDVVEPAKPIPRFIVMANPGIPVSTKAAYEAIDSIMAADGHKSEVPGAEAGLYMNDLEKYTLRDYPEAAKLKRTMQREMNADVVLMSGSGPTMVAYYLNQKDAQSGFERLKKIADRGNKWNIWLASTGIAQPENMAKND